MMCCLPDDLNEKELLEKIEEWESKTNSASEDPNYYETDITFAELFPMLSEESKPIYIDNEAYEIVAEM